MLKEGKQDVGAVLADARTFAHLARHPCGLPGVKQSGGYLIMGSPFSKRKQDKIEKKEVRQHQIKVTLNDDELAKLDEGIGRFRRAEVIRMLILETMPRPVPEQNRRTVFELSRSLGNFATVARFLREGSPNEALINDAIHQVRQLIKILLIARGE